MNRDLLALILARPKPVCEQIVTSSVPDRTDLMLLLEQHYAAQLNGQPHWLGYHLLRPEATRFGFQFLEALAICEEKLPGLGYKLIEEVAQVKFVRLDEALYEQLIQKLAEVAMIRALLEAPWPEGATFQHEPSAPNGKRPELVVEAPSEVFIFEVKCPSLIQHQHRRLRNAGQVAARALPGDGMKQIAQGVFGGAVTWPRDNAIRDFLVDTQSKVESFQFSKPVFSALIMLWDNHMYEGVSPLMHEHCGLLTEETWAVTTDGQPMKFDRLDGVIVMNHWNLLVAATREEPLPHRPNAFAIGGGSALPNVWCRNLGGRDLPEFLARHLDAVPADIMASFAADYANIDMVMWLQAPVKGNTE